MRDMVKWKPFNTLLKNGDIDLIEKEKSIVTKPIITKDKILEIDYTLKEAIKFNKTIEIKYFHINRILYISGIITKINVNEKYIFINNKKIYFKEIINVHLI